MSDDLDQVQKTGNEVTNDLANLFQEDSDKPSGSLQGYLEIFSELLDQEKALKKQLEGVLEKRIKAEETLYLSLEDAGFKSISTDDKTFYRRLDFYASIEAARKEEGFEWLKEVGGGSLIKEDVNSKTFTSFVKELIKEDEEMKLPEYIKTFTKKKVGTRKK